VSGIQALGSTLWHEGTQSLTAGNGASQHSNRLMTSSSHMSSSSSHGNSRRNSSNAATAQYVQL
jgi:hypothetical protein